METSLKILIVEDDEVDRMMARRALKASGISAEFTEAATGREGIALLAATPFDVALIDYQLPDVDGLKVLREARRSGSKTPVIMLTGQGDEQLAVEMMKAGANDYLSKSRLSRDLLSHAVRHAVRLQRAQSEAQFATARSAESEQRFRTMADSAPVLLWVINEKLECVYLNQIWLDFTGQTMEQGTGAGWQEAIHPDDRSRALLACEAASRERRKFDVEFRLRRADGEWRWVLSSGAPRLLADAALAGYVGSCIDITERKRVEQDRAELLMREQAARAAAEASEQRYKALAEELNASKEIAEAANAAKDRFLAVLSHELRTPLTPVLSTVQSLFLEPALAPEVRAALEMIRRNVELEARLIDDLLDLTRIAKGKLELNLQPVEVHECLNNVLDICRGELVAKQLELTTDLRDDRDWVFADAARLQQVFWNILKNAIKFTPSGGSVHVFTKLIADPPEVGDGQPASSGNGAHEAGGTILIGFRDSGIGIDPVAMPRIFDAFEQGERGITRQFGGLGLGLAISSALLGMQRGVVKAQSDGKGLGSVFTVLLPTIESPLRSTDDPARQLNSPPEKQPLRILLVDDHEDTARAMGRLLKGLGHDCTLAGTVVDALHLFDCHPFDLLISDIGLPDGSGLELMDQLRRRRPVPGIALSGFGMEEDVQKSKNAGFREHLTKPINFQRLESVIRSVTAS